MGQRGFTLVEVLVAMFLIGLAVVSAAPLFVLAIRETAVGADLGIVGAGAMDRMELLRRADFYQLAPGGSLDSDVSGFSDTSDPALVVRWRIEALGTPTTLKRISVRAATSRGVLGPPKAVTLAALRAR